MLLIVLIMAGAVSIFSIIRKSNYTTETGIFEDISLARFQNIEELKSFVESHLLPEGLVKDFIRGPVPMASEAESLGEGEVKYSQTNVQVEGIDEADYVKTDGRFLYVVSGSKVYIVRAYPPEDINIASKIDLEDYTVTGLYVNDDRLAIIASKRMFVIMAGFSENDASIGEKAMPEIYPPPKPLTSILIYNISDRTDPKPLLNMSIDGGLIHSRLYKGILYALTTEPVITYKYNDNNFGVDIADIKRSGLNTELDVRLPVIWINGVRIEIPPEEIYYLKNASDNGFQYNIIISIDLATLEYKRIAILSGYSSVLYMSYNNIYLVQMYYYEPMLEGNKPLKSMEESKIVRLSVKGLDVTPEAEGDVPGIIESQLQLDEYDGYLRVSTLFRGFDYSGGEPTFYSWTNIYVLDMDMNIVGKIEGLGDGEHLYATRFVGDYAYLVTFRLIDPLFVVDLRNPVEPKLVGELKIPGFSTMLQPVASHLIVGIGYDADENGAVRGLKISLYDVSDPANPVEIDKIVFNNYSVWSEALYNHRAITLLKEKGLVGIPIQMSYAIPIREGEVTQSYMPMQGLLLIKIADNKMEILDILSVNSEMGYYNFIRGVFINNYIYVITGNHISVYSYPDLDHITDITLV